MAQISYGTITITDTTDIERIYPVYCKGGENTAPSLQPLSNWSETVSQAGGSGDYIWQRIVTKKQNIAVVASDYSDAVRLTGDDGSSLTIIKTQYAQTQNENGTPSYGDSIPNPINEGWWLWIKTIYSDNSEIVIKIKQGQKGETGQRGTSILKVTTAPTTYTTTQGGFTPSYRMSLSTVKSQSGKDEVLIGDIIEYNSNHYRVGYVSSSYVYLSAATSIKGADGQTYYTWIKYAPNDNPSDSQIDDSPTGMIYIGIYTGTSSSAPTTASSYTPWMKYIGTDGAPGVSITGVKEIYFLKRISDSTPQAPNNTTNIISTSTSGGVWTTVVPNYESGAIYYTSIQTDLDNGTYPHSTAIINQGLTDANQKALDAYNTSMARDTEINAIQAQAKHFWWDNEGAHIAAGANTTDVNNITQGQPDTYAFNALTAPGFLKLRYKNIDFTQLATNSLTFYRPATSGSTYVQGKKAMELTADALTFYKPLAYNSSNEPTAAAQLSSTGLNITDGTIQLGTTDSSSITNGNITLSNTDFNRSINGIPRSNLRLAIGGNFGVKNDGTLYASNAVISGQITVGSGSTIDANATINGINASTVTTNVTKALQQSVEYIVGTQTATTNVWTGVTTDSSLVAGKTIAYYLPFAGTTTAATLNLTLAGGGTTGAKNVRWNNSNVTTHYPQYSIIQMTYDGTYWRTAAYNSDSVQRTKYEVNLIAAATITNGHIICGNASGYRNIAASVSFDLNYPLLYAVTAIASGATSGTLNNNYLDYQNIAFSSNGTITSGAAGKMLYLKGTVSGSTFTISASPFLTTVVPSSNDGLYYIPLGLMSSATNGYFESTKDVYGYRNGSFHKIDTVVDYITQIDSAGIWITPSGSKPTNTSTGAGATGTRINANGMQIFRSGTSIAEYGDTVRIGKYATGKRNVYVTDSAIQFRNYQTVLAEYGDSITLYQPGASTPTPVVSITSTGATFTGGIVATSLVINPNFTLTDENGIISNDAATSSILNTVRQDYLSQDNFQNYTDSMSDTIDNLSNAQSVTAGNLQSFTSKTNQALVNITDTLTPYTESVIIENTAIRLVSGSSSLVLDSGLIGFQGTAQEIITTEYAAYITADKLYINNAQLINNLVIGNFKFYPRDGRLTLGKI